MKKKAITIVSALALVIVLLMGLCACGSTYGSIKSAYEKEGYQEFTLREETKDAIEQALGVKEEDLEESDATIHFLTTADIKEDDNLIVLLAKLGTAKSAVICEYTSGDKLVEALQDRLTDEEIKNAYDELQKLDEVNGNCFLILGDKDVFKSTK